MTMHNGKGMRNVISWNQKDIDMLHKAFTIIFKYLHAKNIAGAD